MSVDRRSIREDVRFRVLHLLRDNPEMSQRELSDTVGISLGRTHYVLNGLVEKGMIKIGNFAAAKDKRRYAYILTKKGLQTKAALTQQFLERRRAEYEALRAEIETLEADLQTNAEDDQC